MKTSPKICISEQPSNYIQKTIKNEQELKFYSHSKVIFIKYHFSILGWSISHGTYQTETSSGFSPLRYWGSLYQTIAVGWYYAVVLVPFDIGVVYIITSGIRIEF